MAEGTRRRRARARRRGDDPDHPSRPPHELGKTDWLPVVAPSSIREAAHRAYSKSDGGLGHPAHRPALRGRAERVKAAGLDGIEIECYGHLIDQFWSPATNKRDDAYGGSLDNRPALRHRVIGAIRERVGPNSSWARAWSATSGSTAASRATGLSIAAADRDPG